MKGTIDRFKAWLTAHPKTAFFLRDIIEGAITAVTALTLAFPTSLSDAKSQAIVVLVAVIGATVAVARRSLLPALLELLEG